MFEKRLRFFVALGRRRVFATAFRARYRRRRRKSTKVTKKGIRLSMKRERYATVRTADYVLTRRALKIARETSPIIEDKGLPVFFERVF